MARVNAEESSCAWVKDDGWTPQWRAWFRDTVRVVDTVRRRTMHIREAVRAAVEALPEMERTVVEGYYYDGASFSRIACGLGLPTARVQVLHRRALGHLRDALAGLVWSQFGLDVIRADACPICGATWRDAAEKILDGKTSDQTWGQINERLHRAVGWRATTPQLLITHQTKHRRYVPVETAETEMSG